MGKEKSGLQLKTPKGTKDWAGTDMVIRDSIFQTITKIFKRHGAVTIDTPVFELREILVGKYGEDSKLIYDLQDQKGEICSLRYDLTVPFARWLAMNSNIQSIKRYHIAKVYRRDQPAMSKGRMREFYQCDFDIAGVYDKMVPDAEIIRIICEVFGEQGLGWSTKDAPGGFTVKINHRGVLDGVFEICGVPSDKIRAISSAVDKLDKSPWEEVRKEMVEEKHLATEVADRIWEFVQRKGGVEVMAELRKNERVMANERLRQGLDDMELLFEYLRAFDVLPHVEFNLSLARGLDYYTGVIYEVVTEGSAPPSSSSASSRRKPTTTTPSSDSATAAAEPDTKSQTHPTQPTPRTKAPKSYTFDEDRSNDPSIGIGSVAAGGRYDNLVGMFSGKTQIPCVGISFGVDRIFSITKARLASASAAADTVSKVHHAPTTQCYIMALGSRSGLLQDRMTLAQTLWSAGIQAEFLYKVRPKLPAQFKAAELSGAPFAIILGEEELARGVVKIKELGLPEGHAEKDGVVVELGNLVAEVKTRLSKWAEERGLTEAMKNL